MGRVLIVNADDLGWSPGINRGVARAHEHGIVTSASLMAARPAAPEAAAWARDHPDLSVGLHLEPGDVTEQLETFRRLAGADPTHLDSHHHVHLEEPLRSEVAELGRRLGVSVRGLDPRVRYCGDFYGREAVGVEALLALLAGLPEGVTELGCHPGLGSDVESSYVQERELEVETLCDPRVRAALEAGRFELRSFRDA